MEKALTIRVFLVSICTNVVLALPNSLTGDSIFTSGGVERSVEDLKTLIVVDRDNDDNREENKINVASNSTHNAQTDQSNYIDHDADDDDDEERLEQEETMRQINDFEHKAYEEGLTAKNVQDDANDKDDVDDDKDNNVGDCFKTNQCA
ncbi:hypothetical protein ACTXT7_014309 [Hymenolepis weldensis]